MTDPLRIEFTALAAQHVREAEDWWRLNRPAAPNAIREELQRLLPLIGVSGISSTFMSQAHLNSLRL